MPDKEKIERLISILSSALDELYSSAEDWYREEIPDLIGTTEEELKELGVRI